MEPAAEQARPQGAAVADGASVTSLTERRPAALPPGPRPLPSVTAYDQLLRLRRQSAGRPAHQGEP
ncbi:hypothetical protein AB0D78_41360 [Streptomyces avermitilis]|uniref:hypothetical protein n=1 Tax=Streptomyces avermitilis TaxID=33903 RepID=UPI0033C3FE36